MIDQAHGRGASAPGDDAEAIDRIVQVAGDLIECGESVSIRRVAQRSGVTRETVYRYFSSADSIVLAAAESAAAAFILELSTALRETACPVDAVVEGIAITIEQLRADQRFALLFNATGRSRYLDEVTSPEAIGIGRSILDEVNVDWHVRGWSDTDLDELVEFMLRTLQSFIVDPGEPPRTGESLRCYLRRWVAPAVEVGADAASARVDVSNVHP
ncbi:TetR/AcrR family transcriptional regulator [Gordonia hankookensis]|uniref:TetR/AcrR family transcriptional regulator n=1 Tax=Gordonia hankookensis TaxID=589403 RepID=A0ABR7W8M6_9ACTN|nr:TetR/AcrR family transcriptional regulator [Gordonia hankookensis]MBD1319176.1 TetR/AcrR family transcriptional regulator [Gordonia hankookensis]